MQKTPLKTLIRQLAIQILSDENGVSREAAGILILLLSYHDCDIRRNKDIMLATKWKNERYCIEPNTIDP